MIRHTAAEALFANAFSINGKARKATAGKRKKAHALSGDGESRGSIAALVKIACNASNSPSLRTTACDCLGERIATAPELAAFAARELFARHKAGTAPEFIFNALLCIVREAPHTSGNLFHDAVDALCDERRNIREAAAKRIIRVLNRRQLPSVAVISLNAPFLLPGNAARHA